MPELETWQNMGKGPVGLVKLDARGLEDHLVVEGGKTFTLTKQERQINQDRCVASENDFFTNGRLAHVRLIDGDEESMAMANNPNSVSESDLQALFGEHWKTFEKKVSAIANVITLQRLQEIADTKDDATAKQVNVIKARLRELDPTADPEAGEDIGMVKGKPGINAIDLGDVI